MNDNKSAHMANEYDEKIRETIPYYDAFHLETIDLVKSINAIPEKWLDTGCGTGNFISSAAKAFKGTKFVLADPSKDMLDIARQKISGAGCTELELLYPVPSGGIELPEEEFEVITAIQCHHYLDVEGRKEAIQNCFRMLKCNGVFITFENIRPLSQVGTLIGLDRWKQFQTSKGKSDEEAEKHIGRFDKEYFPITIEEHLELLKEVGFSFVEVFWYSYMQAGFYAIKGDV